MKLTDRIKNKLKEARLNCPEIPIERVSELSGIPVNTILHYESETAAEIPATDLVRLCRIYRVYVGSMVAEPRTAGTFEEELARYQNGEISEGQFAALFQLDRLELRARIPLD